MLTTNLMFNDAPRPHVPFMVTMKKRNKKLLAAAVVAGIVFSLSDAGRPAFMLGSIIGKSLVYYSVLWLVFSWRKKEDRP